MMIIAIDRSKTKGVMMTNYRVTDAWDGVVRLVDHPVKLLTAVKDDCEFLKMDCKGFAFFVNLFIVPWCQNQFSKNISEHQNAVKKPGYAMTEEFRRREVLIS